MYTVTRRGAEIPKSHTAAAARARRELTVAPVSLNDPFPKKFRVYSENADTLIVPLHWAAGALGAPRADVRPPGKPLDFAFNGKLRPDLRQPEAVAGVLKTWGHGLPNQPATRGAMLCIPPGYGKTTAALYLATVVKRRVLVIVHKSFLADQWAERVAQFLPGARVTRVQGDVCDTSGDVVIAMLQTLVSRKYPASTFDACGLLVADEVHHIGAAVFSQAMLGLALPYTLGLSATPDRKDGLGRVVGWFMGDMAFRLHRENQASTRVDIVKYASARYDEPPPVNRRGDVCFTSIITILANDEARTRTVAQHAARLAAADKRDVLVLSHRREHCKALASAIEELGVPSVATYLGGDKTVPDTQVIVATYSLTSEGFDLPRLNALVLATPASDVEQSCGRVMRGSSALSSSSRGALIVDVVDEWGITYAQAAKRRALYKKSGFVIGGGGGQHEPSAPKTFAFVDDQV